MANIRVSCPTCKAELEIGEEHIGQEVECGSCLQPFEAEDPKARKKPYKMKRSRDEDDDEDEDDRRPRRKRRRRDDDDDDYDYSPPGSSRSDGGSGLAVTSLILGILSIPMLCCCYLNIPISIAGIITGLIGMGKPQGRGMAITGLILSIVSLALFGGFILLAMNPAQFNNRLR